VASEDLLTAVQRLIDETASGVVSQYNMLTDEARDAEMAGALLRLVEAEQDRWGRIRISSDGGEVILGGRRLSSALWLRLRNTSLLAQCGSEPGMLQFADRAMIYYVQLLAARTRILGERRAGLPDGDPRSGLRQYSFVREA
jgi:hypothetical protein